MLSQKVRKVKKEQRNLHLRQHQVRKMKMMKKVLNKLKKSKRKKLFQRKSERDTNIWPFRSLTIK